MSDNNLAVVLRALADAAAWKHDEDQALVETALVELFGERPEPPPAPLEPAEAAAQETDRRLAELTRQLDELRNAKAPE